VVADSREKLELGISISGVGALALVPRSASSFNGATGRLEPAIRTSRSAPQRPTEARNGKGHDGVQRPLQLTRGAWWWCILSCRLISPAGWLRLRGAREGRPLQLNRVLGALPGWGIDEAAMNVPESVTGSVVRGPRHQLCSRGLRQEP